jgi:chemotaxis protein methyltransferase CheR
VYTMAIIIASLLREESGLRVQILGTDINTVSLERAQRGLYRDWSFRDMSEELITRWFNAEGENRYAVNDALRSMVEFRPLNLVDIASYPSAMDVILCRNVLMYFTRPVVNDIVQSFRGALRPDGWLVPSMTETTLINQPGLEGVRFGEVTLFHHQKTEFPAVRQKVEDTRDAGLTAVLRKTDDGGNPFGELLSEKALRKAEERENNIASELLLELPLPALPAIEDSGAFEALVDAVNVPETAAASVGLSTEVAGVAQAADAAQEAGDRARCLADAGRLDEALVEAERAVTEHKMSAYCQCIHATILRELGETQRALQAFDRALYLDPHFVPAHFGIGSLYRFLGKDVRAARHLGNALELIEALPDQDSVMLWGDMTARHLAAIIRTIEGGSA